MIMIIGLYTAKAMTMKRKMMMMMMMMMMMRRMMMMMMMMPNLRGEMGEYRR